MPTTYPVTAMPCEVLAAHPDAEAVTVAADAAAWAQVTLKMRDGSAFDIHAEATRCRPAVSF
jgi:hypothetical protein